AGLLHVDDALIAKAFAMWDGFSNPSFRDRRRRLRRPGGNPRLEGLDARLDPRQRRTRAGEDAVVRFAEQLLLRIALDRGAVVLRGLAQKLPRALHVAAGVAQPFLRH